MIDTNITLKNLITASELLLSWDSSIYNLTKANWGPVEAETSYETNVDQIGSSDTNILLKSRSVEIDGYVVAESQEEMTARKKVLNSFVNPYQKLRIIYGDYYIDVKPDESIDYGDEYAENNDVICKFAIFATAGMPLFKDNTPTVTKKTGASLTVNNASGINTAYKMQLSNPSGVTNPKVICAYADGTSKSIQYTGMLAAADCLEIVTEYGAESAVVRSGGILGADGIYTGGTVTDVTTSLTRDSELFVMKSGANVFSIEDANGSTSTCALAIQWSPVYLEVE